MEAYKQIHLQQGSNDWLLWRRIHITATDSAKILNKNPWSSPLECYNEKIEGKETFITAAMQKGMDLEPIARDCLIATLGINLEPKVFESVKYPWMGASLDAISNDNKTLYEIKCVGEKTMQKALNGDISDMYIIQCNKQMLVMDLKKMYLFYYFNEFLHHIIEIERDDNLIKRIIKAETKFWKENILKQTPPEKYGDDYERIENEKANELAAQWLHFDEKEKEAKSQKENVVKQLAKYTKDHDCIFPIAKIRHKITERKGAVDWSRVCSTWNITEENLEPFRKDSSTYSRFSEL